MRLLKYIFLFVLIPSIAVAQIISFPENQIMGFRGLDTKSSAPNIGDSRAEDLLNVRLSSALDLTKRYGMDVINDVTLDDPDNDSPSVTGIFDTEYSDGTSNTLVFIGNRLKYDNSGTWATVDGSTNNITAGKNNQWQCVMALDQAICTNDVDTPKVVTSDPILRNLNTSDLTDSIDKVKTLVWFRNYLIFGNTVENAVDRPTRFRWSNVGTTETWTNDDFNDISTFAGDEIVGFAEMYGDLYIFLTNSIWKASLTGGDDVFVFSKVIDGTGAIARDSIKLVNLRDNRTAVIFLTENKRTFLFDAITLADIGNIIQPTLNDLNEARLQYAVAAFDDENYYLSVSTGSSGTNDTVFVYQTEIFEWTKFDQIDANAMARVKETTSNIKTYVGNYSAFVYWMDNPDLKNDVDGATGVFDEVGTTDTSTITGAQILIDTSLVVGAYTGAIVRITSGTGNGQEAVVSSSTSTGLIVTSALTITPDSTSVYTVGDIDANYNAKHYALGNPSMEKASFLGMLLWAAENTNNNIDVDFAIDFGSNIGSQTVSLSPSTGSLWDSAIWDVSTWSSTGNKIYTVKFEGNGNFIQPKFENNSIDEGFHLFGFNLIAVQGDIKQP